MSPAERRQVAFVEPFWGGSHRAAAEGWARNSRHAVHLEHLPARFWKWRMRGSAFEFARRLQSRVTRGRVGVLFASGMVDLAHLQAFLPKRVPSILYFHETQAAYPTPADGVPAERDLQYAFTNLASAMAADRVAFNSQFHREAFFDAMDDLLRRMPDARPLWALEAVEQKSETLPLGVTLSDIPDRGGRTEGPAVVLWNHRWEYDKAPEVFFRVLIRLADRGVPFRVAVAGEAFGRVPEIFPKARRRLGDRVLHWGYVRQREEYVRLLCGADVVVSTAVQENFGLSIVEAAYGGAHPLVPRALSYPEVIPAESHRTCLYEAEEELAERLAGLLTGRIPMLKPADLRRLFTGFRWENRAGWFDDLVDQVSVGAGIWYK